MLDGLRHSRVDYRSYVAAIYPHAESDSCRDDVDGFSRERVLGLAALVRFHSRMVEGSANSIRLQGARHGFGVLAADAVDDCRVSWMSAQDFQSLRLRIYPRDNAIDKIRAIEHADMNAWLFEPQLLNDIFTHALRGGGR